MDKDASRDYELLIDLEKEKRQTASSNSLAIIRTNVLILAAFFPILAIIFREDVVQISQIIFNRYSIVGLIFSTVAIGSSGTVFLFTQVNSISVMDQMRENLRTGRSPIRDTAIESSKIDSSADPVADLVWMTGISIFLTALSVPLLMLGIAKPFIELTIRDSTLAVLAVMSGSLLIRISASIVRNAFVSAYESTLSFISSLKSSIRYLRGVSKSTDEVGLAPALANLVVVAVSLIGWAVLFGFPPEQSGNIALDAINTVTYLIMVYLSISLGVLARVLTSGFLHTPDGGPADEESESAETPNE